MRRSLVVGFLFCLGTPYLQAGNFCFRLVRVSNQAVREESDALRCSERFSPNSTFKIPLAAMAFENKILDNPNSEVKWDGVHHERSTDNHDQTARSWIEDSVVWVSQWITPQLGLPKIKFGLKKFAYGNQDFSAGLTRAWLDASLKISAREQTAFLSKLWLNQLGLSAATLESVKKVTFIEDLPGVGALYGKTGSGKNLGWFVGFVQYAGVDYAFAANSTEVFPPGKYGGPAVREKAKQLIKLSLAQKSVP